MNTNLIPSGGKLPEHAKSVRDGFTLPPGRTEAEAIFTAELHRRRIWKLNLQEDQKIDRLRVICTALCCGDRDSGERLMQRAVWT